MIPLADNVPRRSRPRATIALILWNVALFCVEVLLPAESLERLLLYAGVVPARFADPSLSLWPAFPIDVWLTLASSMFLHGGWIHLIGNVWSLWIFGDNVEDRMGSGRFVVFYFLCGIAAGVGHVALSPGSPVPTIGASGAIAGVLGAYFLLFPRAKILGLFPIFFYPLVIQVPAYFYLYWWFLTQLLSGTLAVTAQQADAGIAWWAHVAGFLTGVLLHGLFARRTRR